MPNIDINIWAKLHPRSLDKANKDLNSRFQDMGIEAGKSLTEGIEKETPRVRRAMLGMANASSAYAKQVRDLSKAEGERAKVTGRLIELDSAWETQKKRNLAAGNSEVILDKQLKASKNQVEQATAALIDKESEHDELRRRHIKNVEFLRQSELTIKEERLKGTMTAKEAKDAELELIPLRRQVASESERLATAERNLAADRDHIRNLTAEAADVERELGNARKEGVNGAKDLERIEAEINKTRDAGRKLDEDLIRRNDEVVRSNEKREESVRRLHEVHDEDQKRRGGGGRGNQRGPLAGLGNILTDIPGVPSGRLGAYIGAPLILLFASVAEAAVTASQSIALLPAAATAAGAAFGTLALGMNGFGDAVKNMGDPKKFAEALQSLSPAAQQAALEIQELVQGPLGDWQNATQETLFSGVAERIHNVTDQLLPEARALTDGVAGAFNGMFDNFTAQLISPGSQESIANIVDNIVQAFQRLEPAVAPFTDAMTRIIETGSSFLPGFSDAITNAAKSFSAFITNAQANGSLQNFMQKGVDAAVALGKAIWNIGGRIIDTFGNKSPEQFQKNLETAVDVAFSLATAITKLAEVTNTFLKGIEKIPGGIYTVIGAFAAFKALNMIASIAGISSAFGGMGGAAKGAGGGIAAMFGRGGPVILALGATLAILTRVWEKAANTKAILAEVDAQKQSIIDRAKNGEFGDGVRVDPITGEMTKLPGAYLDPTTGKTILPGGHDRPGAGQSAGFPDFANPDWTPPKVGLGPATAGLDPYSPNAVPGLPPESSDKKRRDAIREGMDPNSFMPDMSGLPSMPTPGGPVPTPGAPGAPGALPPVQFGTDGKPYSQPGYGYYDTDQRDIWNAQYDLQKKARDLRDARMDLAVLEKDTLATEEELLQAREKVADEQHDFENSQLDLIEAQQGKWKKLKKDTDSAMGELGAGLDKDLGITKGLSGMADNLVRFLGNLATAPIQAALQNIIKANPNEGSGLVGIAAAQGRFGPQWTPQGIAASGGGSQLSLATLANTGIQNVGMPSILSDTGSVGSGPQSRYAAALIQQMWGDQLKGKIGGSRDTGTVKGTHDAGLSIDIPIGPDQGALGDEINAWLQANGPALGLKYSIWRDRGQYPGGGGFNQGGHQNHIDAHFNGAPGGPMAQGGTVAPSSFSGFGNPGSPQAVANMIFQQATSRGYSAHEAQSIVAYAVGESSLNPGISGGVQGDDEVIGLFQQKAAFARGGGIDPSQRGNAAANTYAYLNQLDKHRGLPIEQALPATSVGGPLASGPGAQPQNWPNLMARAAGYLGGTSSLADVPMMAGGGMSGTMPVGLPTAPSAPAPGLGSAGSMAGLGVGPAPGASQPYSPIQQMKAGPSWQPAGGSGGGGGLLGAAMSAGGMAADMFAPGSGAAAQIAMQMIQRTIKYGGEVAGSLAQGAMQALSVSDPDGGGGTDWSESWIGRVAGSLASAAPALPSNAGKQDRNVQQQQVDPNTQQHGQGNGQPPGPLIGTMNVQADKATGQQMANEMAYAGYAAGLPK
ncbi:hypothetical protein [Mycobacterium phage WXIN]|nr:hypothetical protein [Mycobacterium phage WXIN]